MRMRTIKPGFFRNEDILECEPLARLLFAGLWCAADREGRLEDRPKRLKMDLLPADNCDVDALLEQLVRAGMILRYQVAGQRFIQVLTFRKHNNPHHKEAGSRIPPPEGFPITPGPGPSSDDRDENPGQAQGQPPRDLGSWILDQGSGEGDPGSSRMSARDDGPPPPDELTLDESGRDAVSTGSDATAQPEQGHEDVAAAAAPVLESDGWAFGVDELAQLEAAADGLGVEPQELPGVIGRRLYKRATARPKPAWSMRVSEAWDEMSAAEVTAWTAAAIAAGQRQAAGDPDPSRILDLAGGAAGRELETGGNLPAKERTRSGLSALPGGRPAAGDTAGWRAWLSKQGGIGHEAFVVDVAKSFAKSNRDVNPAEYLALFFATLETARNEAGGGPLDPPLEELCQMRARDMVLQELWDDLAELKGAASG